MSITNHHSDNSTKKIPTKATPSSNSFVQANSQTYSMTEQNVQTLIIGCIQGKQESQLKLYKHFYSYGMSLALRYSQDKNEALEVLNDGFLKAFLKIDQYDAEKPFKPWLRRILINAAIDYYRKYHKGKQKNDNFFPQNHAQHTHNEALENLAFQDLIKVTQQLSPAYRLVFNLYVVEGLSHKEIAAQLGINVGTSKSNLAKARQKLKSLLGASHGIYLKPT